MTLTMRIWIASPHALLTWCLCLICITGCAWSAKPRCTMHRCNKSPDGLVSGPNYDDPSQVERKKVLSNVLHARAFLCRMGELNQRFADDTRRIATIAELESELSNDLHHIYHVSAAPNSHVSYFVLRSGVVVLAAYSYLTGVLEDRPIALPPRAWVISTKDVKSTHDGVLLLPWDEDLIADWDLAKATAQLDIIEYCALIPGQ